MLIKMLINIVAVLVLPLVSLVFAQSPTTSTGTSGTSTASAATHTVSVGADGLNYIPNQITADVGDIVEFRFYPQNHSVARAAFGSYPCIPYEYFGEGRVGFWSGFRPVSVVLSDPPKFQLLINDTEPIFFYCSAPGACLDGMIGVINPNSTFTFAQQLAYTTNATIEFSPMENFPKEVAPSRTTSSSSTPTATLASTAASTSTAAAVAKSSSSLPTGAIVGIAIGGFALLVLIASVLYMCGRQKTVKEILRESTIVPKGHTSYQPASPGLTEGVYPNIQKAPSPNFDSTRNGQFSAPMYGNSIAAGTETETYRSTSPPTNERTGMMGMQPGYIRPGGPMSSGTVSPGSPEYSGQIYHDTPEMEQTFRSTGLTHYSPDINRGPHELAVPSRNPSTGSSHDNRPFSYTDSESGYRRRPDEKSESMF